MEKYIKNLQILGKKHIQTISIAGLFGIEPNSLISKASVLPLNYRPNSTLGRIQTFKPMD